MLYKQILLIEYFVCLGSLTNCLISFERALWSLIDWSGLHRWWIGLPKLILLFVLNLLSKHLRYTKHRQQSIEPLFLRFPILHNFVVRLSNQHFNLLIQLIVGQLYANLNQLNYHRPFLSIQYTGIFISFGLLKHNRLVELQVLPHPLHYHLIEILLFMEPTEQHTNRLKQHLREHNIANIQLTQELSHHRPTPSRKFLVAGHLLNKEQIKHIQQVGGSLSQFQLFNERLNHNLHWDGGELPK